MKRALFISKNLIGDALNIAPALRAWRMEHTPYDWDVDLLTLPDHVAEVYGKMGAVVNVIYNEPIEGYNFKHYFDISKAFAIGEQKKCCMVDAYCEMLGVRPNEDAPTFTVTETEHAKDLILISPFSRSCSSNEGKPPNKMLRWKDWRPIIRFLRTLGPIGVLGGKADRTNELEVSEDEYFTGLPLNEVALMLRDCKLFVSIDNGMSHLAATQQTKHLLFYPACLGLHWAAPWGNLNMIPLQVDPAQADTAHLVSTTRRVARMLLESKETVLREAGHYKENV